MMNKKFVLMLILGLALLAFNGCSDDDDPVTPPAGASVLFYVIESSGGYTDLEVRGSFSNDAVPMTSGGSLWTVVASDVGAGDHTWDLWGDDGSKTMVQIGGPWDISVTSDGTVTGMTQVNILPNGTDGGYVFTVVDVAGQYSNIKFKGTPTAWELEDMTQFGSVWTYTVATLSEGTHEWSAIEDDGSDDGIRLPVGPDPTLEVDASGAVAPDGNMIVVVYPPM